MVSRKHSKPDLVRAALAELDAALEQPGDEMTEHLARALRAIVALREHVIAEGGGGAGPDRVNAVLSAMWSAGYPIVGVRRQRIVKARDAVRDLLDA